MTRYVGRPGWVNELLAVGEHPHVDYKQVLPKQADFAKAVCAAANTVALRGDMDQFVFLVGVKEVVGTAGVVSGTVTGLVNPGSGTVRDIEAEKLAIVNAVRDVEPSPDVEIDECATGSTTPFLAVRVTPTEAPHRVGDRYLVRRGSHTVPLEAHQLRRIFVEARSQAFIDEIREDNHLTQAMRVILAEVRNLSQDVTSVEFAVADEAAERRRSDESLEQVIEGSTDRMVASEEWGDLIQAIAHISGEAEGLYGHVTESTGLLDALQRNLKVPTLSTARHDVARSRQLTWAILCAWKREGDVPARWWNPAVELYRSFFFNDVATADPESVMAERVGWLHRTDEPSVTGSADLLLDRACHAAIDARLRERSGPVWMQAELDGSLFDAHSWWVALASRERPAPPDANPEWNDETALVLADPERIRSNAQALGADPLELDDDLLVFRLSDCRIEMRLADRISALLLRPNPHDERFPASNAFLRQMRMRLKRTHLDVVRCFPMSRGQLAPLAGERSRSR